VRLSHLSLSLFRLAEDGSEDAGKLLATYHLSDVISIRTRGGSSGRFGLQIGDSEGQTLSLLANKEEYARAWVDKVMATKNELLDAVRQLDQSGTEPSVIMVTARDAATLGPFDCVVSSNVVFRSPFRLPFLTKEATVLVQLTHGTLRLTGADLCLQASKHRSADVTDGNDDDEGSFWVRAARSQRVGAPFNSKPLQVCVQVSAVQESVPVGVLNAVRFWRWISGTSNTAADGANLPRAAAFLGQFIARPGANPASLFGALRTRSAGLAPALEGALAVGLGTLVLALTVIAVAKSSETSQAAHRLKITLVAFSWDEETVDLRGSATETDNDLLSALCPDRFVRMVRGDVETALQWWQQTKAWRASEKPEELLVSVPRPSYHDIKGAIEHFYHKRDRLGRLVYYEVLNSPRSAFRALRAKGWSVDDVVAHMMFLNEYAFRELLEDYDEEGVPPKSTGQLIKIMDIQNLGLGDIGGDVSSYFNKQSALGKNYPERMDKIVIINVPAAFGMIWNVVAPLLDRNVRERISIFRGNYYEALVELIEPENIPSQYGGQCRCGELGCRFHSPEEVNISARVVELAANETAGGAAQLQKEPGVAS